MKNTFQKSMLAAMFLLASMSLSHVSKAQAPVIDTLLNNKIYTIELTEDMGKKNKVYPDELNFKGDKLKSKKLSIDDHFKSAKFTATQKTAQSGTSIDFECTMKNDGSEEIIFSGTVTGKQIEGTAEWNKKDGSTRMLYNITGALKEKKVPGQKAK